ncbi:TBC-domain-containing protein [Aspergillus steynii IBT 23096]|uniref:TBC-domain-containing protein n=1 Tax=Aspergillus steynii IBT 23096 TaxID=1392250 RepID=A0A2I2FV04_9EURO|nr:TBC-domain-containing protein [Aspergillus steynii IBT 23096]PLB44452.1 TBC-domain-containing protein [Aspergillus steynii IBT 23096]
MAEHDARQLQRRSSSRTSSSSRHSQKAKTVRAISQKRLSASSNTTTDLTSFPSLSPDRSPDGFLGQPALNSALSNALLDSDNGGGGGDAASDTSRDRRATLAKLTGGFPPSSGRAALFGDSVPIRDVPGALHLADDAHIERLISTTGAVKLVRQFARDLAQRDAEISALRQRADARERELKRMLREVSVSNQDIERRLYALENAPIKSDQDQADDGNHMEQAANSSSGVHGLMQQALTDGVGTHTHEEVSNPAPQAQATIRPQQRLESDSRSGTSSVESGTTRKRQSSLRSWQDYIFGSTVGSRKTSRASSIMSEVGEIEEESQPPRNTSNPALARRKALDDQLFQPPPDGQVASVAGDGKRLGVASNGDDNSVHSRKSSKSLSSWTLKLFAGNSQPGKEENDTDSARTTASSNTRERGKADSSAGSVNPKGAMSAVAALKRINSNTSIHGAPPGRLANGPGSLSRSNQVARRSAATSASHGSGSESADKNATNLGPVEMDAILPMESRPPTLSHVYNYQPGELLTDRFGFIYDQRRKKRQREAGSIKNASNRLSIAETLSSFRSESSDGDDERDSASKPPSTSGSQRSPVSASPDDPEAGGVAIRRWQDYLKIATGPAELLSHTPSAGPIVSLTTGEPSRNSAVSVDKRGSLALNQNFEPSASTSTVTADRPEFSGASSEEPVVTASPSTRENEPVKLLLEQLTDLHDSLQRDRTVRWNEFLRKVRAERRKEGEAAAAAAAAADRPLQSVHMPEASLADGEVVGISGLGNKGKVGRAKWREFRTLVLGGIPVALRAKIWSECSGASSMRIPGYYDELVKGTDGCDPDASVISQIDMDINRTLTGNVFFRKGPGVTKLKEVLLAYSRRNPEVGYCQGMNLIAASLLLITPTAEDAFWILASMIEVILPQHYYDHGLLASRADQVVLRQYISQVLPKLAAHLETLGVELEALTFQWFLSVFTDCLSAEALYRVWDVVLCLNVTSVVNSSTNPSTNQSITAPRDANEANASAANDVASGSGGGSTFLFQVALALLKLNEQQLLTTCSTPAELYTYINHQMTNHAISIDGLIQASEALRNVVRREDVVARRTDALREMREFGGGQANADSDD